MAASGAVRAEAAGVLLRLCRQGLTDADIGAALETSGLSDELITEIRTLATEIGIVLPTFEACFVPPAK